MKIGDRVKVRHNKNLYNRNINPNMTGKIITFYEGTRTIQIGVEFDENIKGHDCYGQGKDGHCAWITKRHLKLEEKRKNDKANSR